MVRRCLVSKSGALVHHIVFTKHGTKIDRWILLTVIIVLIILWHLGHFVDGGRNSIIVLHIFAELFAGRVLQRDYLVISSAHDLWREVTIFVALFVINLASWTCLETTTIVWLMLQRMTMAASLGHFFDTQERFLFWIWWRG